MKVLKKIVTDQMGNEIELNYPPQRIVSLVPSQTELLHNLGLGERVVGITKFCELPQNWLATKTKVGGTKKLNFDIIDSLKPDLIIGNKEENDKQNIEALQLEYPVWMSDISSLMDAQWMIQAVGKLTEKVKESKIINDQITQAFSHLRKHNGRVLYLIWRNPWMGAGSDTFIHSMLQQMGLLNVLEDYPRYPELSSEQIQNLNPDHIFLSSEPYPFQEKHFSEFRTIAPHSKLSLVDGKLFSWYGSRLIYAPGYFDKLL